MDRLDRDKNDIMFTALNNGDIKSSFMTKDRYKSYLKSDAFLSFEMLNHVVSLPGVMSPNGLNIVLFNKESFIVKKTLEKEKVRDDFVITCQNHEEIDNLKDTSIPVTVGGKKRKRKN